MLSALKHIIGCGSILVALDGYFELHIVLFWIALLLALRAWNFGIAARTASALAIILVGYFDLAAIRAARRSR